MLFFMVATYIYSLWLKETYKPKFLERRRKRLGIEKVSRSTGGPGALRIFLTVTLFRPLMMLIIEPIVSCFGLYVAVDFGILYIFLASFPLVYSRVYDFNPGEVGLTFVPIVVGCWFATITCLLCGKFFYQKQLLEINSDDGSGNNSNEEEPGSTSSVQEGTQAKKHVEPEYRLYPAMIGNVGLPLGLFWFAWTARSDIHWASPVMATMIFSCGNLCVFVSSTNLQLLAAQLWFLFSLTIVCRYQR